jgi:hypothetical protein
MKNRLLAKVLFAGLGSMACVKQGMMPGNSGSGSKLTSVKMKMPTKIGDKDVTGKMDGYQLSVKKTGGTCVFSDVERTEKVSDGDVKIDATLKQGCDYSIALSFGIASTDGKQLEKVYLSSNAYDGKTSNPTLVKQDDLKGKSEITIKACVSVTSLGAKDLGVSAAECPSVADDSVNGTLEPVIPQPTPTSFKISKAATATIKDANVLINGEVTSIDPKTVFCGLALHVKINNSAPKVLYVDENILEVKINDKKPFEKSFDAKEVPAMDPNNIGAISVLELCTETKPDPTKKAHDLLKDCLATGKCPVVSQ